MQSLFDSTEAKQYQNNPLSMRAYTSRLLGANQDLVMHGGGNTSVKIKEKNFFGKEQEILYVKGSGHDLASIKENGFAPVKMETLLALSRFSSLTDHEMVREQKLGMTDLSAPGPSVEAILHALIPYTFVDHTHADAVVTISNTPDGTKTLKHLFGENVLFVDYVMPGFVLAKKVFELTKDFDQQKWDNLQGMVLLNHGVFTFDHNAQKSYEKMIELVSKAEQYLEKQQAWIPAYTKNQSPLTSEQALELSKLRKSVSIELGSPVVAKLNNRAEIKEFASRPNAHELLSRGTITPDHSIHTKPFPAKVMGEPNEIVANFRSTYTTYFNDNCSEHHQKLDCAPRYALWPNLGLVSFGPNRGRAHAIYDITEHLTLAVQRAEKLQQWQPLSLDKLFEVEYWELEQAKLKKAKAPKEFDSKVAVITGAASGIGLATAQHLAQEGAIIIGLDIDETIQQKMKDIKGLGFTVDLTDSSALPSIWNDVVKEFGGIDHLVLNAGSFPKSCFLDQFNEKMWDQVINLNLNSHVKLLASILPFLEQGLRPSVVVVGSKNVPAPGPGASAYSTAKAGLTQFARVASMELASKGIRVNTIHPNAVFDTGIWSSDQIENRAKSYNLSVEEYKQNNLLKVEITSSDVAKYIAVLLGNTFAKTTGAQIPVDGGNDRVL